MYVYYIYMCDLIDKVYKPLFVYQSKCTLVSDGKQRHSNKSQQQKQQSTILDTRIRAALKQTATPSTEGHNCGCLES